jgi:hypothetical protein
MSNFLYVCILINNKKMKKIYISICTIAISVNAIAQLASPETINTSVQFSENSAFFESIIPNTVANSMLALPIWEEDFSGGFPQGWSTYTSNTQGGFATCPWVYTQDGSWGYYQGTQGASAAAGISSTTALNGYLISDTDSANHHSYGQPSGTTYEYIESYFTTSAINLSMNSAVSLEFEHLFRYNNLGTAQFIPPTVSVSSDSITWTNYQVNGGVPNNTNSSDPEIISLNISSIAGNQATVYIKIGWTSRCYYWMIDDMKIVETPPNLLAMQDETFGGWLLSNPTTTGDMGIPYTFNPMKQAVANPYRMEATILNKGGLPQLNTKLNTIITDGASTVYFSDNSTGVTLNILDTITVSTQNTFQPTNYGSHLVEFWGSSDSASTDTVRKSTIVTDTIYGRDYDWDTDGANAGSGYYLGRHGCGQVLANAFEIYVTDTVTSISFHVNDQSVAGAELNIELHEYDPSQSPPSPILLEESDSYTLTASDIGNWMTLKLLNPTPVFAGTAYLAVVKGNIHPTDTSLISSSGEDGVVSFIQDNGCDIGSGGLGYWYSASKTLMIRMNLGGISAATGISDNYFNGYLEVYPNPSNGKITLEMNKVSTDQYNVNISNLIGQTVYSNVQVINGFFKEDIDISTFGKGTYLITISNSSTSITEKLIVE